MPLAQDITDLLTEFLQLSEQANARVEDMPDTDATIRYVKKLDKQESVIRQKLYIMDSVLKKLESGDLSDKEYDKQERIFFAVRNQAQTEIDKYEGMVGEALPKN